MTTLSRPTSPVTAGEFLAYLFFVRDTVHLTHLYQRSKNGWEHKALDKLYKEFTEQIDTLVESYQGIYGQVSITIPKSEHTDPIPFVKGCYQYIESNRSIFKESWLQNIIDEIQQLMAQTLFRLQFVK